MAFYSHVVRTGRRSALFQGLLGLLFTILSPGGASAGLFDFFFQPVPTEAEESLDSKAVLENGDLLSVLTPYLDQADRVALGSSSKAIGLKMRERKAFSSLVLRNFRGRNISEEVFRSLFSESGRFRYVKKVDLSGVKFQASWLEALPESVEELILRNSPNNSPNYEHRFETDETLQILRVLTPKIQTQLKRVRLGFGLFPSEAFRVAFEELCKVPAGVSPKLEQAEFLGDLNSDQTARFYQAFPLVRNAILHTTNRDFFSFDYLEVLQRLSSLQVKPDLTGRPLPAEFLQMESFPNLTSLSLDLRQGIQGSEFFELLPNLESLKLDLPWAETGAAALGRLRAFFIGTGRMRSMTFDFYPDGPHPLPFESIPQTVEELTFSVHGSWNPAEFLDVQTEPRPALRRLVIGDWEEGPKKSDAMSFEHLRNFAERGPQVLPGLTHLQFVSSVWVDHPASYYGTLLSGFSKLKEIRVVQPGPTNSSIIWFFLGASESENVNWNWIERHTIRIKQPDSGQSSDPVAADSGRPLKMLRHL